MTDAMNNDAMERISPAPTTEAVSAGVVEARAAAIHAVYQFADVARHEKGRHVRSKEYERADQAAIDAICKLAALATDPAPVSAEAVKVKPLVDVLAKQLAMLSVASCTCGTKSPQYQWHDANCRFRLVCEAQDNLDGIRSALVTVPVSGEPAKATGAENAQVHPSTSFQAGAEASQAARDVLAERRRQVEAEGWAPEHDDTHRTGSIALAAACYARFAAFSDEGRKATEMPAALTNDGRAIPGWSALTDLWPWHRQWWKPSTRRRDLVKAGALILAEIERLDRLPGPAPTENGEVG